jgi:very-short-patch-repair endonuclease
VPIDRFVGDFFCADGRLIIEIDGGQHDQDRERDANRTKILEAMGYLVLRFWNNDVMRNADGVLEVILSTLNQQRSEPGANREPILRPVTPSPQPSPQVGRGSAPSQPLVQ